MAERNTALSAMPAVAVLFNDVLGDDDDTDNGDDERFPDGAWRVLLAPRDDEQAPTLLPHRKFGYHYFRWKPFDTTQP